MRRYATMLTLTLLLTACKSRAAGHDPNADGGPPVDGALPADAAPLGDGAVDCEVAASWQWSNPAIDSIYVDPAVSVEGETVRIVVTVLYDGCDRFVSVSRATDVTTQEIRVWPQVLIRPPEDGCVGELAFAQEYLVYGALTPGTWTVSAPWGGVAPVSFDVLSCPVGEDCFCTQSTPNLPFGSTCTYQCECAQPNACVRYLGVGGEEHRQCLPSCSDDSQCAVGYFCVSYDDGPSAVCQPDFTGPVPILCTSDAECGQYERCFTWSDGARSCELIPVLAGAYDYQRCDCGEQCGGLTCIAATGEDMFWSECHLPCRGDRDCPSPLWACGAGSPWSEPICYFEGD